MLNWLRLPEMKSDNKDALSSTLRHAEILRTKPFLRKVYEDFYQILKSGLEPSQRNKKVVELGSGGGFIKEVIPYVVTSDVIPLPDIDLCFSACEMPFKNDSVDAFVMIDVFHHISDVAAFLREGRRCLKHGGKIVMIEPANTWWSRFIYKTFHHEDFDEMADWRFHSADPLYSANMAIPWMVFLRDRRKYEDMFPDLRITMLQHHTPFRYLISGGFSLHQLAPAWSYDFVGWFEALLAPLNRYLGMFITIELEKSAQEDFQNSI